MSTIFELLLSAEHCTHQLTFIISLLLTAHQEADVLLAHFTDEETEVYRAYVSYQNGSQ